MFQRKVEPYHEEYFDNIENAREYAKHAEKSMIRYKAFLKHLRRLDIKHFEIKNEFPFMISIFIKGEKRIFQ